MMAVETPVLTNQEAVEFLRLDTDFDEPGDSIRALHRLVRQGKLRPLRCGRSYKFTQAELERFIVAEVGPSVTDTDGNGK